MFERFTERARKVMALANQEAQRLNHDFIGTEHILLGLLKEGSGVGANVLKNLGADLHKARREVEKHVKPGPDMVTMGKLPQTPRAKKVIEYSIEEARNLGHNYVGTEHVLLGLLRETEGTASRVLDALGLKLAEVRQEVLNLLGTGAAEEEQAVPAARRHSKTPALDKYSRDLTALAADGDLDPAIGRDRQIERAAAVLCRRQHNHPVLLGPPGVGRSSVVEGLAQRIAAGDVPQRLSNCRIVALDVVRLVAGAQYRGQLEERVTAVLKEARRAGGIILFLDDVHQLMEGEQESVTAAFRALKPALSRGECQCIGAADDEAWRSCVAEDASLGRLFEPVPCPPPDAATSLQILRALAGRFEAHHDVRIRDEAIVAAVELGERFLPDRFLPDKAMDLIDEAASRLVVQAAAKPPRLLEVEAQIERLVNEKEQAVRQGDYERAAGLREQEESLRQEMGDLRDEWRRDRPPGEVDVEAIIQAAAELTGIDAGKIRSRDASSIPPPDQPR